MGPLQDDQAWVWVWFVTWLTPDVWQRLPLFNCLLLCLTSKISFFLQSCYITGNETPAFFSMWLHRVGISLRDCARTLFHLLGYRMVVVSTLCIERHGLDCYCLGLNLNCIIL